MVITISQDTKGAMWSRSTLKVFIDLFILLLYNFISLLLISETLLY